MRERHVGGHAADPLATPEPQPLPPQAVPIANDPMQIFKNDSAMVVYDVEKNAFVAKVPPEATGNKKLGAKTILWECIDGKVDSTSKLIYIGFLNRGVLILFDTIRTQGSLRAPCMSLRKA